ncbi:MAG: regulator of sirC expression with transglutaminase-like and TPR domain [Gammaproteobacteria bacterium]|jgi:regulator of sirC expression with transglutaminase-like and TPR domain
MMADKTAQSRLQALAVAPDDEVPLAEGALLISAWRNPGLEVARYLSQIDALVAAIAPLLPDDRSLASSTLAINQHLFTDVGFCGNTDDYADVRNSFLNEVLERKLGIPITLSVLYIEVAQKLGLPACGISFPGHFLVRLGGRDGAIVIDPFFSGLSLSEAELVERMRRFVPDKGQAREALNTVLHGAPNKEILSRMLRNLRALYVNDNDLEAALAVADQIVAFSPADPMAVRERAELYFQLEVPHAARADYRRYLELAPDAGDAANVRERLVLLERTANRLN